MKKTLVALAALASMSAFAQSSVTLYGIADVWLGNSKTTVTQAGVNSTNVIGGVNDKFNPTPPLGAGNGVAQNLLGSGGISGSRWGLKGSEDLGGGLKANFQLESGFNIDTGTSAQGGALFGRQAFVGLSGGFGAVNFGRMYPMYDQLRGGSDPLGHSAFSATAGSAWAINRDYAFRINNAMSYDSPNLGGFSAGVTYGLGENKTATTNAGSIISLKAVYANGPIMAGLGYQVEKNVVGANGQGVSIAAAVPADSAKETQILLTGSYDFGVAKVRLAYNRSSDNSPVATNGGNDRKLALGVSAPIGPVTLAAEFANTKNDFVKGNAFGVQAIYSLSKRTSAYVGFNQTKANTASPVVGFVTTNAKSQLLAVGVTHAF